MIFSVQSFANTKSVFSKHVFCSLTTHQVKSSLHFLNFWVLSTSNQIKELQTNMPTDGSKASIWYIPSFLSHTQTYALKHSHTPEFSNAHSFLENVSSHNSIIVKFDRTTKREVLGLRKKNTHRPSNLIHLVQTRKLNKCF